ncbi:MAG: F0F1 ATP synthase subunit A [Gammaproteobacteria bacterium]|nr:F0F1 ATP synthase subunit A [Gammaproteobacteria bacterium]
MAAGNATDYIVHHLGNFKVGEGFWTFNLDTLFFSILLGAIFLFIFIRAAKSVTSGVPGRFQAAVEVLVEMVNDQAKNIIHHAESRKFVAPLALTVFVWVFLMNSMDFLPVDLLPTLWAKIFGIVGGHDPEHAHLRVVPTADLNATLGMSLGVLLVCLYYNVKIKGFGGWMHELFTAPFGSHPLLYPINFAMQMIEFTAKTVSHGMRLFGNMYAGELLFMLIALMGAALVSFTGTGITLWFGHVFAGTLWAIFHILIVALQAFIFMMLTLVYIGQAHESH